MHGRLICASNYIKLNHSDG